MANAMLQRLLRMVVDMNSQIKQRLFITVVVAALVWLMCAGIFNLISVDEIRTHKRNMCIDENIMGFEYCFKQAERDVSPNLINYLSPFLPIMVLVWINWVLKLNFQIELNGDYKKTKFSIHLIVYLLGILGFILPIYNVISSDLKRIYEIQIYATFTITWLVISWVSMPIFFQKLVDNEKKLSDFSYINKIIYLVIASPILAFLLAIFRTNYEI
jgi:hypothetical protein